jgi:2-polyprenyl-3-methyl-5-hydroxy-6-metoxy-1,4-benzoquinol methylase
MHRVSVQGETVAVVGAGGSPLVEILAQAGRKVVAVDIAEAALDVLRASVSSSAPGAVTYKVADVRELQFDAPIDAWHDRAVFHFLTTPDDQRAYVQAATAAVRSGGHCVIASFAPDGPTMCSGLPTAQHDADSFRALFTPAFTLVESFTHDHVTPWDSVQRFTYAVLQRL